MNNKFCLTWMLVQLLLCHGNLCRKRSSGKGDFAVSANMAYGEVNLHTKSVGEKAYKDHDKMARSGRDNSNYELIQHPLPSDIPQGSQQTTSEYATADETSNAYSKQQQHSEAEANDEGAYDLYSMVS